MRLTIYFDTVFILVISERNSVDHGDERLGLATKYWAAFDIVYTNNFNKITTEQEQIQILTTAHIGRIHSIRQLPWNTVYAGQREFVAECIA